MELQFIEMGKAERETGLRGRNNWFCFRRGQFEILVTCLGRHGIMYTNELKAESRLGYTCGCRDVISGSLENRGDD